MSSLSDFKIGRLLGKGSFGELILVQRIIDGQIYAMKQVRMNQLPDKEKQNPLNEIRILASLSHKNIIDYKEAFFDENSETLNILMEYTDNGDMSQKIKYYLENGLIFSENIIWNYLIQILEGLHYLHEHNIIHRDLTSANIFLTQEGIVKIGGFYNSKIAKIGVSFTQTCISYYASHYISPEIWLDKPYDYKSDVWSLGCILYELCQLKPPFGGTSLKNLKNNIQSGIYEPIMNYYSKDLRNIIDIMLRTDRNMRPNTGQILKSKIINNKKMELIIGKDLDSFNETEKFGQKKLIDIIKIPKNMKEINGNLPSNKYNKRKKIKIREEMMKEDAYENNKKLNGFLNEEDKNEIKKIYGNDNYHDFIEGQNEEKNDKKNKININKDEIKNKESNRGIINLDEENNKLKREIAILKKENQNLKNDLQKANKAIQNLIKQQNKNNNDNIEQVKKELILTENKLKELEIQIENGRKKDRRKIYFDDIIVISFTSTDQKIIKHPIKCLLTDTFAEVEEKLYQQYEDYNFRDTNNTFIGKGKIILRFKKLYEIGIEDGDTILLENN